MSKREVNLYLSDIDDAIATIKNYTEGMTYEELVDDRKTREAVILNFVVLGEAIKKLPSEIIDRTPDVPWKEFAGMRDKMVHGYFSVSTTILWETIRNDLPACICGENTPP
jgi:uncharacterized protein with HEPN domain